MGIIVKTEFRSDRVVRKREYIINRTNYIFKFSNVYRQVFFVSVAREKLILIGKIGI
jgi:hypothetical protein